MRYAIIENGVVTNIVEAEPDFAAKKGWVECQKGSAGWSYADGVFTPPPPAPAPEIPLGPTKEELLAQLQALQAQIQALE